jgi:hypothetical protein
LELRLATHGRAIQIGTTATLWCAAWNSAYGG